MQINPLTDAGGGENPYRVLFESTIDCAFHLRVEEGPRFVYAAVNQAAQTATGLSSDALVGRTPLEMLGPEKGRMMTDGLESVVQTGETYRYEPTWNLPGGAVTYDAAYIPLKNKAGRVTGIFGVARDITELRRLQAGHQPVDAGTEFSGAVEEPQASGLVQRGASNHVLFTRQLRSLSELSDDDVKAIHGLPLRLRTFAKGAELVVQKNSGFREACLVLEGMACRSTSLQEGRRQIVSLHLPGDLTGLDTLYVGAGKYVLEALTPVRVAFIPASAIRTLMESNARVRDVLMRVSAVEKSISRQWTAVAGVEGPARVAHLLCECIYRLRVRGLAVSTRFDLPLTQSDIGDAVGLSAVHVNRSMKALERSGVITRKARSLLINDWDRLQKLGNFDPAYLHVRAAALV